MDIKYLAYCLVALFISISIRTGVVHGSSMHPILKEGKVIIYNTTVNNINKNNIYIIKSPEADGSLLVKRIIGLPNDIIYLQRGFVVAVNDMIIPNSSFDNTETEVFKVPPNGYYYIGDNQMNSIDSRHYGVVSRKDIIGRVEWSL